MRVLLLIKWLLIISMYALAYALAYPLLLLFCTLDTERTHRFAETMGRELHRRISLDFQRLRFRR